jgi:hypothetical protein
MVSKACCTASKAATPNSPSRTQSTQSSANRSGEWGLLEEASIISALLVLVAPAALLANVAGVSG